jgi:hypothetical protein
MLHLTSEFAPEPTALRVVCARVGVFTFVLFFVNWPKICNRDYSEWVGPERRSKLAGRSSKAYSIAAACSGTNSTAEVI